MILLRLFWEFFQVGLFSIGGGMAAIPFLYDLSDRTGWFTYTQLADMIAVSESTPGPIGVNMATYVGFRMSGIPGAVISTLGFVAPSILIIILVSAFLHRFRGNRTVENAFYGLRPASSGLIASAALSVVIVARLAEPPLAGCGAGGVPVHRHQPEKDQTVASHRFSRVFRRGGDAVSVWGSVSQKSPRAIGRRRSGDLQRRGRDRPAARFGAPPVSPLKCPWADCGGTEAKKAEIPCL